MKSVFVYAWPSVGSTRSSSLTRGDGAEGGGARDVAARGAVREDRGGGGAGRPPERCGGGRGGEVWDSEFLPLANEALVWAEDAETREGL